MKEFLLKNTASLVRFALGAFAGWVTVKTGYEITTGDASAITVLQVVGAVVLVAITFSLKMLDGTKHGPFIRSIIGPRVLFVSHSIARFLVSALAGGVAALLGSEAANELDADLGDDPAIGLVVLLCGIVYDRWSKSRNP